MSVFVSVRPSQIRILNDWKLFKVLMQSLNGSTWRLEKVKFNLTSFKVEVEVEAELGNNFHFKL